jgi:hypothetical protein
MRTPKRAGVVGSFCASNVEQDAAPYAYVHARWNQIAAEWSGVIVTAPYPHDPVMAILLDLVPVMSSFLSMIGSFGLYANIAPFRGPPSYWLDRCAGGGGQHAILHGCRPCGADVIVIDIFGVAARDWSPALEARAVPVALQLHSALAAIYAPWRPT